jgi:ribonuclease P protein component, eubacterial
MNKKNTLGKKERLKSKKLIGKLFEEGKSIKKYPFRLIYLIQDKNSFKIKTQASFSVPKRNFKKAVDRNRIKRLIKEAYRLEQRKILQDYNLPFVIMITYLGKKEPIFCDVKENIKELLTLFKETEIH